MFKLYEEGKQYWTIIKRVNQHPENPLMRPAAIKEFKALRTEGVHPAIERRINTFIWMNQPRGEPTA